MLDIYDIIETERRENSLEKKKNEYIENMCIGNIVAFKREDLMFSGKVVDIADNVTIQTPNNSIFYVEKTDIVWVKVGTKWPLGIYNALKYSKNKEKKE
mgnify:FL=1